MTNIQNIDEMIVSYPKVESVKKSVLTPIIIAIAGIALLAWSLTIKDNTGLKYTLLSLGTVLAIVGIGMTLKSKRSLFYIPTGEKIEKKRFFFDQGDQAAAWKYLSEGNLEEMLKIAKDDDTSFMVVYYATPSKSFICMQPYEYIPHQYEASKDTLIFTR